MARTQAEDYDQRKLAIVEAAAELFARHGFLGASLVDLANRCKVSKSLIYHYCASKEDILFEVMSSHLEALNRAADEVAASGGPPEVKLRELTHAFMALYVGAAARHKVLLNELEKLPKARRAQVVKRQRRLIAIVETLLVELQPSLSGAPERSRPATMLFFGMINWTHTWFDPKGKATAQEVADMAVDLTLKGLQAL